MKKKLKIVFVTCLVMLFCFNTLTFAASGNASGNATLTPSKTEVKSGENFTVVVSQECSDGIIGAEGKIEYDTNVFNLEGKTSGADWTELSESQTEFNLMQPSSNDIKSGELVTFTFKVKEGVAATTSEIKLTGIKLYKDATDILNIEDKAVSIKVNEGNSGNNNDDNNNNNQTTTLSKIEVASTPSKTEYNEGEKFSTAGMVIKATYSDGTTKEVTNYTYSPNAELKKENKLVTVSYTEGDVTKTATQAISVKAASSSNGNNNNNNTNRNTNTNTNTNNRNNNITNNTNTTRNTNNTTNNTNKTANNTNTNKDNTLTGSSLPKTGSRSKYILLIVAGLIGISYVSYKGYQKYKDI